MNIFLKGLRYVTNAEYRTLIKMNQGNSVTSRALTITIIPGYTDGRFEYKETDNKDGMIVTKYLLDESDVVVPDVYNNLPIVEIGEEAFMDKTSLYSIDLPDTITIIHARAFKGCSNLSNMR